MSRTFPMVILLVATLVGGGGGYLTNAIIGQLVALPDGATVETPSAPVIADRADPKARVAAASRAPTERQYLERLLCRNLFNKGLVGECSFNVAEDPDDVGGPSFTDMKVTLLGTLVASPAEYSSALILKDGDERAHGYSIDDVIGDARITAIESKLVKLVRDNKEEILRMDETSSPAPKSASSAPAKGGDDEVTELGENSYAISSDTLDKYLNDLEGISRMGRALLHRGPDGEFDGYRLSAIRRNTIADKLGIRNGDIIHAVNGTSLNSMSAAMEAFNTMQNEKSFEFEVTRRGQKVKMQYQVQ